MLCFGVPLLSVMAAKSLRTHIHINWTLPAYLSLIPLTCHSLIAMARLRSPQTFIRRRMNGVAWTFGCCIAADAIVLLYLLVLQPRVQLIRAFGPWSELAGFVDSTVAFGFRLGYPLEPALQSARRGVKQVMMAG